MGRNILLVEPGYRNKYPPLGLMKLSQYHKQKGDNVEFVKGQSPEKRDKTEWDRIYVSSLFTFDWAQTIKALKYYKYSVREPYGENLVVGGVLATLLGHEIVEAVPCRVVQGPLDERGKLGYEDDDDVDALVPDYSILEETDYNYPTNNAYIGYATRGCIRKCGFCAVRKIEPQFRHYLPIGEQIKQIEEMYGRKRDLLLLDNNVLASREFGRIIGDIKGAGFEKGAAFTYAGKNGQNVRVGRRLDFNQGIDLRLLDDRKMGLLSETAIRPLRLAFDDIALADLYCEKVRLAAKSGIKYLSNYILFNFDDRPEDLYERLKLNVMLNEELGLQVYSFPMRYVDIYCKDRLTGSGGNVGRHWNRKYLRAIQCILTATRGVVGTRLEFFEAAFGRDVQEYLKILMMPEDYIINRRAHEADGSTDRWWAALNGLSWSERQALEGAVQNNQFRSAGGLTITRNLRRVLAHYSGNCREYEQLYLYDEDPESVNHSLETAGCFAG